MKLNPKKKKKSVISGKFVENFGSPTLNTTSECVTKNNSTNKANCTKLGACPVRQNLSARIKKKNYLNSKPIEFTKTIVISKFRTNKLMEKSTLIYQI